MAFSYCTPASGNVLLQGEILQGVFEIRPDVSRGDTLPRNLTELELRRYDYPYCIVVTNDCDLDWDYRAFRNEISRPESKLLMHVLFCPLETRERLRAGGVLNSGTYRRARSNTDVRWHCFREAPVDGGESVPELIADFKSIFGLPVDYVYALLRHPDVKRLAQVPTPYMQHFMQRFYFWQSRIALPDE